MLILILGYTLCLPKVDPTKRMFLYKFKINPFHNLNMINITHTCDSKK